MTARRVFLMVLDSVGAGYASDASEFGDEGAHTLRSAQETGRLRIDHLLRLGLSHVEGLSFLGDYPRPIGSVARLSEASRGKDTTIGHWELAGHISPRPLPTFPDGFPDEILSELSRRVGRPILCNRPYSGTAVIRDFGEEQIRTGGLIVYTSADSVFQIAAHVDVVPLEELYEICRTARELLVGDFGVGRVIARPFAGKFPDFKRTADRRDFSLEPPARLLPDAVLDAGLDSIAVGKIGDIFAGRGFTRKIPTHSNEEGMAVTINLAKDESFSSGLCFVNLVDFDMLWGHRRDAVGYAEGLSAFDVWLGEFLSAMREEDVLLITADHGCDPSYAKTTDHTREDVPLLIYQKGMTPKNFGVRETFADVGATVATLLNVPFRSDGESLI